MAVINGAAYLGWLVGSGNSGWSGDHNRAGAGRFRERRNLNRPCGREINEELIVSNLHSKKYYKSGGAVTNVHGRCLSLVNLLFFTLLVLIFLFFCNKHLQYHFFCSNLGHYICKTMTNNIKTLFSDIFLMDVLVNMSLLIFCSAEHLTKFTQTLNTGSPTLSAYFLSHILCQRATGRASINCLLPIH